MRVFFTRNNIEELRTCGGCGVYLDEDNDKQEFYFSRVGRSLELYAVCETCRKDGARAVIDRKRGSRRERDGAERFTPGNLVKRVRLIDESKRGKR